MTENTEPFEGLHRRSVIKAAAWAAPVVAVAVSAPIAAASTLPQIFVPTMEGEYGFGIMPTGGHGNEYHFNHTQTGWVRYRVPEGYPNADTTVALDTRFTISWRNMSAPLTWHLENSGTDGSGDDGWQEWWEIESVSGSAPLPDPLLGTPYGAADTAGSVVFKLKKPLPAYPAAAQIPVPHFMFHAPDFAEVTIEAGGNLEAGFEGGTNSEGASIEGENWNSRTNRNPETLGSNG